MWRGLTPVQPLLEVGARSWLNLRSPIERQTQALLKLPALLVSALSRVHLRVKYWVAAPRLQQAVTHALASACARGNKDACAFLHRHRDYHRHRHHTRAAICAVSVGVGTVEK